MDCGVDGFGERGLQRGHDRRGGGARYLVPLTEDRERRGGVDPHRMECGTEIIDGERHPRTRSFAPRPRTTSRAASGQRSMLIASCRMAAALRGIRTSA